VRSAVLLTVILLAAAANAEPIVIVNLQTPVAQLTRDQARKLLLGEELSWPDGELVSLVEVRGENPSVVGGYLVLAHKTLSQMRAAWNRLVFSGRANPPLRYETEAEVRNAVARLPGAIAVIDSSEVDGSVKIVLRIGPG
jgi:ABC-type phosphate transport system substrate-binding protein